MIDRLKAITKALDRIRSTRLIPYLVVTVLAATYSYFFIGDGYCPRLDEGYLQSIAARVLDGQSPYEDFYFLRTPLSIYIQTFFLYVLGGSYTILMARVFWFIQCLIQVVILSLIYRDYLSKVELTLMLVLSYVVSTLLLSFPWYSYDAIFFVTIAAALIRFRKFFWSGLFMFLAFLCKQNYILVLPLLILFSTILWLLGHRLKLLSLRQGKSLLLGFLTGTCAYALFLVFTGNLWNFAENVFLLPRECGSFDITFVIFQDNLRAFKTSLPVIVTFTILFYLDKRTWPLIAAAIPIVMIWGKSLFTAPNYVYMLIYLNYALCLLFVVEVVRTRRDVGDSSTLRLLMLLALAVAVQYIAGFNYSGLLFANQGAAFFLPISYITFRDFSPSRYRRPLAVVIVLAITVLGVYHKHRFIYHETRRTLLTEEFSHPKLAGIRSTPTRVNKLQSLIGLIDQYSDPGDYIFVFPDYPALYFLTDRMNPTPVGWFHGPEYSHRMLLESIDIMKQKRPAMIFIHVENIPDELEAFLTAYYTKLAEVTIMDTYLLAG